MGWERLCVATDFGLADAYNVGRDHGGRDCGPGIAGGELVSTGQGDVHGGVPRLIGWPRKKPVTLQLLNRSSPWLRK